MGASVFSLSHRVSSHYEFSCCTSRNLLDKVGGLERIFEFFGQVRKGCSVDDFVEPVEEVCKLDERLVGIRCKPLSKLNVSRA